MNRFIVFAVTMGLAAVSHAAAPAAAKKAKSADESAAAEAVGGASAADRDHFARRLKTRLDKIQKFHQARMDFYAKESEVWNSFWTKVRDDRRQFEIRNARQTLGLFDSLASLDAKDHSVTISDFERLQSNVIKNFENSQRQKLQDFFAMRDGRWKDFATEQERERSQFMAEALAGWEEQKSYLKGGRVAAAPAAEEEDEPKPQAKVKAKTGESEAEEAEEKPLPLPGSSKKGSKSRPAPTKKAPVDQIESWN